MEEGNNLNPEVNSEPKMPKKSKKKVIIIGIVVVLILAIAAVVFCVVTGKINFTKKSKLFAGIEKAKETVTAPIDALMDREPIKIADNLADSDIQYTAEITGSIDSLEVQGMDESAKEIIETVKPIINGAKIGLDLKVDAKEKAVEGNVKVSVQDLLDEVSADVVYNNNAAAVRLPEWSEKYLAVFGDTLAGNTEYAELAEVFTAIENMNLEASSELINALTVTEEQSNHFEKTYDGLFKKTVESDMIETKSGKIKVDGKEKSCTKVILTLGDKEVQKVLKAYIEAFEDDDEGKKILVDKVVAVFNALPDELKAEMGVTITADMLNQGIDEVVSQLKDSLDQIEFEGEIVITTYSSLVKTYAIDFEYTEGDNSAVARLVFGKEGTDIKVSVNDEELVTGKIINDEKTKALKLSVDQSGVKADVEVGVNLKSNTESEVYVKGSMDYLGQTMTAEVTANVNVTKNEANEYATETRLNVKVDAGTYAKLDATLNIKESMKAADVTVAEINRTNAIDVLGVNSEVELQNYLTEIQPKAMEMLTKVQESSIYKALIETNGTVENPSTDPYVYDYNTTYPEVDMNTLDMNSVDMNGMLDYSNAIGY